MNSLEEELDDAINMADLDRIKSLIAKGANIEYRDPQGCTGLMNAAWVGSHEVTKHLLSIGADKSAKNSEGKTALDMAESVGTDEYGHDKVIKLLKS